MTPEQHKTLDKLLDEDAKLVRELRSLDGGAEDGAAHLLTYEVERIMHLKSSIAAQRSEAQWKRHWDEREASDRKASIRNAPKVYENRDRAMPYVGPDGSLTG